MKIFHAGSQLFGIIEKGAYDFIIRGSVQGRTVKFEIAPTDGPQPDRAHEARRHAQPLGGHGQAAPLTRGLRVGFAR